MRNPEISDLRCFLTGFIVLVVSLCTQSQNAKVQGRVFDASGAESLPGVNIIIDKDIVTTTDANGFYSKDLPPGPHTLVFKFIGYAEKAIKIMISQDEILKKDIIMQPQSIELNTAVISASRYEQRLSDVIVSMEVLPASFIESVN
ncbi:MAG TPA: carboxypeptidase-like regulatory domain-containing protein, partial [Bacteroidales bacterium]|nr:carboxypeptidase-like regulatory domain-containing protein [Bacteroidales bacterium]